MIQFYFQNWPNYQDMFEITKQFTTKYCPTSVEFIDKWNLFIVATYELSDLADKRINNRFGGFVFIQDNELILEHDTNQGGVFDFQTLYNNDSMNNSSFTSSQNIESLNFFDKEKSTIQLYSAHSNGNLSLFELCYLSIKKFEFKEINSIKTGSDMLTCLDLNRRDQNVIIIVGDSNSTLTIIKDQQILNRIRVNSFDYPIWTVRILDSNINSNLDQIILLVGSDDCSLRCFMCSNKFKNYLELFKNDSFDGGVTSIELIKPKTNELSSNKKDKLNDEEIEIRECNTKISNSMFKVLVGSYDEKVRIMTLKSDFIASKGMELIKTVPIKNAGIWKIKHYSRSTDDFYLITGMYSGIHLMKNDQMIYTFNQLPSNNKTNKMSNEIKKSNNEFKEDEHLIYGCCFNRNFNQLLITSFYMKKVYLLSTNEELIDLLR